MQFHIILGHQTAMGQLRLFCSNEEELNLDSDYNSINDFDEHTQNKENSSKYVFAIVTLHTPLWGIEGHTIIGYKYDIEDDEKQCRIAFNGKIRVIIDEGKVIKLFKNKCKKGIIDRIVDNYTLIVKDLFSK